jgi:hypothetical protein
MLSFSFKILAVYIEELSIGANSIQTEPHQIFTMKMMATELDMRSFRKVFTSSKMSLERSY